MRRTSPGPPAPSRTRSYGIVAPVVARVRSARIAIARERLQRVPRLALRRVTSPARPSGPTKCPSRSTTRCSSVTTSTSRRASACAPSSRPSSRSTTSRSTTTCGASCTTTSPTTSSSTSRSASARGSRSAGSTVCSTSTARVASAPAPRLTDRRPMVPPFGLLVWAGPRLLRAADGGRNSIALYATRSPSSCWSLCQDLINLENGNRREESSVGTWALVGAVTPHIPTFGHSLAITKALCPRHWRRVPVDRVSLGEAAQQWRIGVERMERHTQLGRSSAGAGGPQWSGVSNPGARAGLDQQDGSAFTVYSADCTRRHTFQVHRWDGTAVVGTLKRAGSSARATPAARPSRSTWRAPCTSRAKRRSRRPPVVVTFSWSGTSAEQPLGSPTGNQAASRPQIAVGSNGHLAVAFVADPGTALQQTRCATWNGTQWQPTAAVTSSAGAFSLGVDSTGDLVVAYAALHSRPATDRGCVESRPDLGGLQPVQSAHAPPVERADRRDRLARPAGGGLDRG